MPVFLVLFYYVFLMYVLYVRYGLPARQARSAAAPTTGPKPLIAFGDWRTIHPAAIAAVSLALAVFTALIVAEVPAAILVLLGISALVALEWFVRTWVREFVFLMSLEEGELPGRFDKVVWAFLMLALPPLGLRAFLAYRRGHWPEPVGEPKPEPLHDLY